MDQQQITSREKWKIIIKESRVREWFNSIFLKVLKMMISKVQFMENLEIEKLNKEHIGIYNAHRS